MKKDKKREAKVDEAGILKLGKRKSKKSEDEIAEEGLLFTVKHKGCKMLVCEDLETGEIKMKYGKSCPVGFVERVAGRIASRGISFVPEQDEEEKEEKE